MTHQGCPTYRVRAQPHGSSSGADLGFWASPHEMEDPVWAGFEIAGDLWVPILSTRRTILVGAIHPPASPAIGPICHVFCMQVDEQSEQETHAGEDGLRQIHARGCLPSN